VCDHRPPTDHAPHEPGRHREPDPQLLFEEPGHHFKLTEDGITTGQNVEGRKLGQTLPVFIALCNNNTVRKLDFDWSPGTRWVRKYPKGTRNG
jgi:hypothetical protein